MNKTSRDVIEILFDYCKDESFKIIDAEDILASLDNTTAEELYDIIDKLNTESYVEVKYSDKTEYCLTVTKKGKLIAEEALENRVKEEAQRKEIERLRAEQIERQRAEQIERVRIEAESKNKKSKLKTIRKKESVHNNTENIYDTAETIVPDTHELGKISDNYDAEIDKPLTDYKDENNAPSTIVLREVMLNRDTMRAIAKIAFFSGFIGAVLGSLVISLIFLFV